MWKWFCRIVLLGFVLLALPRALVLGVGIYGMLGLPEAGVVVYLTREDRVADRVIRTPGAMIGVLYYDQFAGGPPFAACAADATGHWGWAGGEHSVKAARLQALARCGKTWVVTFETRTGPTVSQEAATGIARAMAGKPAAFFQYDALAEAGSWAVQALADGHFLPQWRVLNRCRALLEPRRDTWPRTLAHPQCRIFRGAVPVVRPDGTVAGAAARGMF